MTDNGKTYCSAIGKTLMNSLVIDDGGDSSAVNYRKSDIDGGYSARVTFDELYDIFLKNKENIFSPGYDTGNCVTLIMWSGDEIPLSEADPEIIPVFLKIHAPGITGGGNDIIINFGNGHAVPDEKQRWMGYQSTVRCLPSCKTDDESLMDFNGYENSVKVYKEKGEIAEAVAYCLGIKTAVPGYRGYLPAAGQMDFLMKHLDMVNYIFGYFGIPKIKADYMYYWTSTVLYGMSAWMCCNGNHFTFENMDSRRSVLPMFIKI